MTQSLSTIFYLCNLASSVYNYYFAGADASNTSQKSSRIAQQQIAELPAVATLAQKPSPQMLKALSSKNQSLIVEQFQAEDMQSSNAIVRQFLGLDKALPPETDFDLEEFYALIMQDQKLIEKIVFIYNRRGRFVGKNEASTAHTDPDRKTIAINAVNAHRALISLSYELRNCTNSQRLLDVGNTYLHDKQPTLERAESYAWEVLGIEAEAMMDKLETAANHQLMDLIPNKRYVKIYEEYASSQATDHPMSRSDALEQLHEEMFLNGTGGGGAYKIVDKYKQNYFQFQEM